MAEPDAKSPDANAENESAPAVAETAAPTASEKDSKPEPQVANAKEGEPAKETNSSPSKDPEEATPSAPEKSPPSAPEKSPPSASEDVPSKVSEPSPAAKDEDVQMTGAHPENECDKSEGPSTSEPQAAEPADRAAPDTEMTDPPAVDSAKTPKPDADMPSAGDTANLPASEVDLGPTGMSQLAIDSTEKVSSPARAPADVSMTDAPPSVKIARQRDEDSAEEPAPKRARTEPMEDAETAPAQAPAVAKPAAAGQEPVGLEETSLTNLSNWRDEETNSRSLTQFQRREIRKVIDRVKKTKSGAHFRDSVQKLWPALWDSYMEKIQKPMDLGELGRSLKDPANSPIATLGDFRANLALVFENALAFNGSAHDVTAAAAQAVKTVWEDVLLIPADEPARPKAVPKPKPVRESRAVSNVEPAAVSRRQSAEAPTAAPAAAPAAATINAASAANIPAAPQEPTGDRRSSTATDGDRPKRTVRAPKPKDIDYTTKPSRKKLKPELQFCDEVLTELMHPKNFDINQWFLEPVDAEGFNIPTYYTQIKKPMDLGKVQRMLGSGEIASLKDFDKNVRLIFENCYKFNGSPEEGNPIALIGKRLEDHYVAQMKNKDAWLSKHAAKAKASRASVSNASDDDDEDDDEGDDAVDVVDSKELEELQAKLEEETRKLNGMLVGGNQSLIDIQKGIVDMVQNALIKAAQSAQVRAKNDRSSKKSGKGGKAKASGGPGGRKSTGGASQSKKSGGSKKAAAKKSLTAADKDQIATAINDLEYPHLERAIDLIKKDTGQLVSHDPVAPTPPCSARLTNWRSQENTDGELELDIDQLSNDALFKLWDLCKKALPGFGKDSTATPNSSAEVNRGGPVQQAPKTAAKPKKNKPMSAQEQESRIAQLTALREMYHKPGQEPAEAPNVTQTATPMAESSDDSDSEEE